MSIKNAFRTILRILIFVLRIPIFALRVLNYFLYRNAGAVFIVGVVLSYVAVAAWLWPASTAGRGDYVKTMAQLIGGGVLLFGLFFTYQNLVATHEAQITDRFYKAVEQLGSDNGDVRVGALYALERLSLDSDRDYEQIIKVICSLIRRRSEEVRRRRTFVILERASPCPIDIATAFEILCRRSKAKWRSEHDPLDLRGAYLAKLDIRLGNLDSADFSDCVAIKSTFLGCSFSRARFNRADLRRVTFETCTISDASFVAADFSDGTIDRSHEREREILLTQIRREKIRDDFINVEPVREADFSDAIVIGATFNVDMRDVVGLTAQQAATAIFGDGIKVKIDGLGVVTTPFRPEDARENRNPR